MIAWVLRFALFGIGNPGSGVIFPILSMIVYGMAFDFFNISGSLFVEKETDKNKIECSRLIYANDKRYRCYFRW
jgi:hypothetical protein